MTTLVTGAFGCIGAWVVRALLAAGERPVLYDLGDDPWRVRMIAPDRPHDFLDQRDLGHAELCAPQIVDLAAADFTFAAAPFIGGLDEHAVELGQGGEDLLVILHQGGARTRVRRAE